MEEQIRTKAYFLHLKYPNNSSETNWYLAEKYIKNKNKINYDNNINILDILEPNFYTLNHFNIDDCNIEELKDYIYKWGMTDFFDIIDKLIISYKTNK